MAIREFKGEIFVIYPKNYVIQYFTPLNPAQLEKKR